MLYRGMDTLTPELTVAQLPQAFLQRHPRLSGIYMESTLR